MSMVAVCFKIVDTKCSDVCTSPNSDYIDSRVNKIDWMGYKIDSICTMFDSIGYKIDSICTMLNLIGTTFESVIHGREN